MRLIDSDKTINKLEELKLHGIANGESDTVLKMYQWMISFTALQDEVINLDVVIEKLKQEKENMTEWAEDVAYEMAIDKAISIINDCTKKEEIKTDFEYVLPERLKEIMKKKHINQRELAEKTGMTEVSISRYINGIRVPNAICILDIAKALNCNVDELLY